MREGQHRRGPRHARHANETVPECRFIAACAFSQWWMARLVLDEQVRELPASLADMGLTGIESAKAASVFRALMRMPAIGTPPPGAPATEGSPEKSPGCASFPRR